MLFSVTENTFWFMFVGAAALTACSFLIIFASNWMIAGAVYGVEDGSQKRQDKIYECANESDRLYNLAGYMLLGLFPVALLALVTKTGNMMSAEFLAAGYLLAVAACVFALRHRHIGPAFNKLSGMSVKKAFRNTGELTCIR